MHTYGYKIIYDIRFFIKPFPLDNRFVFEHNTNNAMMGRVILLLFFRELPYGARQQAR
jgi:hypothetical protein